MPTTDLSVQHFFQLDAVLAALASFLTCIFLVGTKKFHGAFTMDSSHGVQKMHTAPTPRIAGVALVVGVLVGYAFSDQGGAGNEKRAILSSILLAGLPAFIFGLLEDITKKVSVRVRLLATMASGLLGWGITGVSLTSVDIWGIDWLLGFTFFSVVFTAFAVGGVANSINIIDGFNGLTAGVAIIMLTAFGLISHNVGDHALAFTCLVLGCSVLGFFLVNWPYGKIFLGDGGAYFLGFAIAWVSISLVERNESVSPWCSLLICSYPIMEVAFSIYRRKFLRTNCDATQPDAVHLHSLTNKRWVKKILHSSPKPLQNGFTSPFLWLYSSISCIFAIIFYNNKVIIIFSLLLIFFIYIAIYNKLAFFRWIPKKSKL